MESDRGAPDVTLAELIAAMPQSVRQALPTVLWRLELLWQLDLPIQQVAVRCLEWQFDLPLWQWHGVRFQVGPRQVWQQPARFRAHHRRVMAGDLGDPIYLVEHNGRMVVLDGFHRLLQAAIRRHREIDAMVLSAADLAAFCGPEFVAGSSDA